MDDSAFLVIDVQNDFCPGGALAAPDGDRILVPLNRHLAAARSKGMRVYASRDWHPAVTNHFKAYGGEWPPHCVQGTWGAEIRPDLELPRDTVVITKGDHPQQSGYSVFDGLTDSGVTLLDDLRARQIDRLFVAGIAADYCVKVSVLDALHAGLRVTLLPDAIASIDVHPGDAQRAFDEMTSAGAELAETIG